MGILKQLGIKKPEIKKPKKKESLEEWQNKIIIMREKRTNPYNDFIKKCCIDCDKFSPTECFTNKGNLYVSEMYRCIKVRSYLENKDNYQNYE